MQQLLMYLLPTCQVVLGMNGLSLGDHAARRLHAREAVQEQFRAVCEGKLALLLTHSGCCFTDNLALRGRHGR
jgi:hypothetical protein